MAASAACWLPVLLLAVSAAPTWAAIHELYTTNAVCVAKYCVNPVFPGLAELPSLQNQSWTKQSLANISNLMSFCGKVVDYDVAISLVNVSSSGVNTESNLLQSSRSLQERFARGDVVMDAEAMASGDAVKDAVLAADRLATRQYFYHLQGMGIEPWEQQDPMAESSHPLRPCARTVARMVCSTFFPQAPSFVADGQEVEYLTPCQSSCQSYVDTCGVTCCDEGVTCAWDADSPVTTQGVGGRQVLISTGYAKDARGEDAAATCTGASGAAAPRGSGASAVIALLLAALTVREG